MPLVLIRFAYNYENLRCNPGKHDLARFDRFHLSLPSDVLLFSPFVYSLVRAGIVHDTEVVTAVGRLMASNQRLATEKEEAQRQKDEAEQELIVLRGALKRAQVVSFKFTSMIYYTQKVSERCM